MLVADGWSLVVLIAGSVVLWVVCMVVLIALCAAMADGDTAEVERAERERAALGRACSRREAGL
jgi:hypothetical protein